jgi:hypothetical protein
MSVGFLTLKRDIQDFPRRLNEWTKHTGIVLQKGVEEAQSEIDHLQSEIELYVFCNAYKQLAMDIICFLIQAR